MPLLPGLLPGADRDVLTIGRPTNTADTEGNYVPTLGTVTTFMGSWGAATAQAVSQAAQRGETIDSIAICPQGMDILPGDIMTAEGHNWVVVATYDMRVHIRVMMLATK